MEDQLGDQKGESYSQQHHKESGFAVPSTKHASPAAWLSSPAALPAGVRTSRQRLHILPSALSFGGPPPAAFGGRRRVAALPTRFYRRSLVLTDNEAGLFQAGLNGGPGPQHRMNVHHANPVIPNGRTPGRWVW